MHSIHYLNCKKCDTNTKGVYLVTNNLEIGPDHKTCKNRRECFVMLDNLVQVYKLTS